jgi:hypothetical protein
MDGDIRMKFRNGKKLGKDGRNKKAEAKVKAQGDKDKESDTPAPTFHRISLISIKAANERATHVAPADRNIISQSLHYHFVMFE